MFLAGAVISLPLLAQTEPTFDPQTDPKVIYEQNFESDWDAWSTTSVDTINGVDYFLNDTYKPGSNLKIWENKAYQTGFIHRDTLIHLYNGVMLSDNKDDFEGGDITKPETFKSQDIYTIVSDAAGDATRQNALDEYGTDGGTKYFRFTAGDGSSVKNASGGSVPEYRRNLFIRLTPGAIDENSSYRVTMYMKTTKRLNESNVPNATAPNFRAELMRGYFSSEKNFSMGRDVSSSNTFTYSKDDFVEGEWTKITYMSYFLTNEIAEQFCYYNQYHDTWCDYWKWNKKGLKELSGYDTLYIIRQPNKFFLRVSFRGDSTVYDLDNISITKSTIGGIQHTGNMLRVDFGYQTNLKDQAKAAKVRTNIAAVEVPGQFFTVWGKDSTTHKWRKVEINTAEYHDDGYMYMWSKPRVLGGVQRPQNFDGFDEVRVDFTNPSGVEYDTLALKYTGTLYPNALDEAWVEAGKRVFDFKNELSTPNPNISKGVYPLKNYPPVLRPNGAPYEDGSFGLDPATKTLKLILSRKLDFDADETDGSGKKAFCQVFKNGSLVEIWPVQESTDTYTIFKRQATTPLDGDYTFKFVQIKGVGDANYSDDIVLNYSFGDFNKDLILREYRSDWRHEDYSVSLASGSRYYPKSVYIHSGQDPFTKGTGKASAGKCGLYPVGTDDGFIYISNRGKGNTGNLYSIETIEAGEYNFSFKAFTWNSSADREFDVYIYPKPAGEITSDDAGFAVLESAEKTMFAQAFKPTKSGMTNSSWPDGTETFTYPVSIPATGEYVIEWVDRSTSSNSSGSYRGFCVGDYSIKTPAENLSANYVSMINVALQKAEAKKTAVDGADRKYKGETYTAMTTLAANVKANIFNETAPSKYEAAAASIDDAVKAMQARMDTVDLYYTAMDTVTKALAAKASYSAIEAYSKLNALKTQYNEYNCERYSSAQVSETADILNAAVANLNDRITKTDGFAALLESTKKTLDSTYVLFSEPKLEGKDLVEYDTLKQTYEAAEAKKATLNTLSDDEFFALYDGMVNLNKAYLFGMDAVVARTRQIRELYALADSLGYDFGGAATKDSIKNLISGLRKRDAVLENVIREAVVLQIYKKFAAGVSFDSLDVSALIPNYFLYTDGVAGENMEQKSGVWVVKAIEGGNSTALPGWTFASISGSNGYWMPTTTTVGAGDGHDWVEGHTFISGLRCGPQTAGKIELTDSVVIPAGMYIFGMRGYNQTSNVELDLVSDSCKVGVGDKSSLNSVWNPAGGKFNYKTIGKDSITIAGKTTIVINQTSGSSSEFDMRYFYLTLCYPLNVDYAALASAQETKLADLITFVAPVSKAADAVAVQYFNLNGVQVAAPESGKIVIKRTILSNGKSVAEKILVK